MTRPDIEAIEGRWLATTPGEWRHKGWRVCAFVGDVCSWVVDFAHNAATRTDRQQANAEFAASAHQDIPALIAYVRVLEAENERMRVEISERIKASLLNGKR